MIILYFLIIFVAQYQISQPIIFKAFDMQRISLLVFSLLILFSCVSEKSNLQTHETLNLTPRPQLISIENGHLNISNGLHFKTIMADSLSNDLKNYLENWISYNAKAKTNLELIIDKDISISKEGYLLAVDAKGITLKSSSYAGVFYGVQTLSQLLEFNSDMNTVLPYVNIQDEPRFAYRGFMLDVSRHFFPLEFVKKQIDLMAHYKLNTFHWHLTDGPGWRLEIEKYPKLTDIAAWRTHKTWKEWWDTSPRKYVKEGSKNAHGGYYTQEEARELVKYAAKKNITVIPEIEMPGHSEEVLAVYPQLSCTGKPYTSSEFCIGNEETFEFLENVLSEVIDIFPSEYIHIGGDEASKRHWKECPKCQVRMKSEGLKDESELQSYLIKRIEKFLNNNGRRLLGWDEILEGGLAPDATVMSWRGKEGGIKAVQSGHQAVMTPGEFCYLDSYQANPDKEPEAIGGFLPLEKVYSYNPVPDTLKTEEAERILGVQANLWTEYVPTQEHAEYMIWPRLIALSEVAWTQPKHKDWDNFKLRINDIIPLIEKKGYNPYTLSNEVAFSHYTDLEKEAIMVSLSTERAPAEIRYTTDGSLPTLKSFKYKGEFAVADATIITAQVFMDDEPIGKAVSQQFDYHRAIQKDIVYNIPINKYYPAGGADALIDGQKGGLSHGDGRWQGFMTQGIDVTIDMGEIEEINSVSARFMQSIGPWIWFPKEVEISLSTDNNNFTKVATITNTVSKDKPGTIFQDFGWSGSAEARYIKYRALPNDVKGGWVFLDEIVVW